jgi:hypothetical protein
MMVLKAMIILLVTVSLFAYFQDLQERKVALSECIQEVSNNCAALIEYASMLESENARLNKLYRACQK